MSAARFEYFGRMDSLEERYCAEKARIRAQRAERIAREARERMILDYEGRMFETGKKDRARMETAGSVALAAIETRRILAGRWSK
jgi:hypothetical protein